MPRDSLPTHSSGDVELFYERSAWPLGTLVRHPADPAQVGSLVRRVARAWVDRDRRPPMVRWHGKIDAVEVPWDRLTKA